MSAKQAEIERDEPRVIGRYVLYDAIAHGGMASVHLARQVGDDGFSRVVAVKRLHPQFAEDPEFVAMFKNEARIASRVHHPNVVPVLDLVVEHGEVMLVQEYVHGVPLDKLFRRAGGEDQRVSPSVVVAIMAGVLAALHAAHETKDERGEPLGIIHRDVSPHNVVVGEDGVPRLLDFGIAKARTGAQATRNGLMKGKLAYMAPEQFRGEPITRRVDVYGAGVVLWELLTMRRLHAGRDDLEVLRAAMHEEAPRLTAALARRAMGELAWRESQRLEPVVARALAGRAEQRFASCKEALEALVSAVPPAPASEVAEWVTSIGKDYLDRCQSMMMSNEDSWRSTPPARGVATSNFALESGFKIATRARAEAPSSASDAVTVWTPRSGSGSDTPARAWVMRGALALALVSFLVLVASLARREPPPPPAPPTVVTVLAPAPPTPPPTLTPVVELAPLVTAAPPPKPAPARITWKPAPVVTHAPSATASVPRAEESCDPPSYFEGTKKVFKPGCM